MVDSFKIAAISSNSNSFGLHQFVAINATGKAFKACKSKQFIPNVGQKIEVLMNAECDKHIIASVGELAESLPDAPPYILQELWPENY